jgi:hypothetical protein
VKLEAAQPAEVKAEKSAAVEVERLAEFEAERPAQVEVEDPTGIGHGQHGEQRPYLVVDSRIVER